jgi:hypothetical protein
LFQQYDLLSGSSLFDARFYVDANPDIADLNLDPLTHYLEIGCHERRDPSPHFKTSYYLRQCKTQGEAPANPLLHYLTVGAARGLNPSPAPAGRRMNASAARAAHGIAAPGARSAHQKASERHLYVDVPLIIQGAANSKVHGGLSIAGWTLARSGIDEVYISVDGLRAAVAYLGIRRPDVASEYSTWEGAMQSGFAAHVPPRALKRGRRLITVTARDRAGVSMVREFSVDVEELSDQSGPGSLRRKITQSEVELHLALLDTLKWRPRFTVWQALTPKDDALTGVRRTLHSLSRQAYPDWRLYLQRSQPKRKPAHSAKSLLARCVEGFEHHAQRIRIADQAAAGWPAQGEAPPADAEFILRLAPGDELGCDALLEFALASGFAREADLLYSDERRADPVDGRATAFFKPRWSPDLLLSTNYIGRAWCAKSELVTRAGIDLGDPAHRHPHGCPRPRRLRHRPAVERGGALHQPRSEAADRALGESPGHPGTRAPRAVGGTAAAQDPRVGHAGLRPPLLPREAPPFIARPRIHRPANLRSGRPGRHVHRIAAGSDRVPEF